MRAKGLIIILTGVLATSVAAQQAGGRDRALSRECRREVVQLCGMNRSEIRSCLKERHEELSPPCKAQMVQAIGQRMREDEARATTARPARRISYGSDPIQKIDLFTPATARPAKGHPLLVYVHGGGWRNGSKEMVQQKPDFFNAQGWGFASVGYRLLPDAPVEQQAADVAAAIARLSHEASALGIDPDRVIVMGHSAGAHLAALVSTDPAYLGADLTRLAGVILLDGAGYDVASQMQQANVLTRKIYEPAFGTDPARQARLSPTQHAAAPNAPRWLILHVARRADSREQSATLAAALQTSGAQVQLEAVEDVSHMTINRELGQTGNRQTSLVQAFLAGG
ncbi:alpha/beta hydrolase [Blastomonas sp. AAP53]|uniref:alpha/beta hydrolase n=1 Tax=Blastomonas sp. AAP53 TaxID=1248760 RepID=UPI0002D44054|nr:alpha/beta hydrolase [Blastomonas sp. AAP53]